MTLTPVRTWFAKMKHPAPMAKLSHIAVSIITFICAEKKREKKASDKSLSDANYHSLHVSQVDLRRLVNMYCSSPKANISLFTNWKISMFAAGKSKACL